MPETIGRLSKLRELWVHGNALDALPEALGRCASLTVLQALVRVRVRVKVKVKVRARDHHLLRELP